MALLDLFPSADLYLHVCDDDLLKNTLPSNFQGSINKSLISKLPFSKKMYQKYLAFMPFALEQLDLTEYDLVISSESGPSKGVITRPDALHVCYCHSPMRYLWDMYHEYKKSASFFTKLIFPVLAGRLRMWDRLSADRVDYFIANSSFVASRINKYYRRESKVIYPPVSVDEFSINEERKGYYLYLGQLVRYKKADLAVEAFNKLGLPLKVVGEGELFESVCENAQSNVEVMGRQPFEEIKRMLSECKALIFPGVEDFGIVPVEAMASGAPVIAYAAGGVLDSVIHGETGIYFDEQTPEAICEAVMSLEAGKYEFDREVLRAHSRKFSDSRFKKELKEYISNKLGVIL